MDGMTLQEKEAITEGYPIEGKFLKKHPTIARVKGDRVQFRNALRNGIIGTIFVLIVSMAFLRLHSKRVAEKLKEAAASK